jgi:hypothetical protein
MFMVDAGNHKGILVRLSMFWMFSRELFNGYQRQLLIFVTEILSAMNSDRPVFDLLVRFACRNLSLQMTLLIIEILQLKM